VGEERVIVTDIPGTTRDHVEVPLSLGGVPIRLTDTAGLRRSPDPVEAIGIGRAERLARSADVLVWLGDPADAPDRDRVIRVHSKSDLADRGAAPEGSLPVSASTHDGLVELVRCIEGQARSVLPGEGEIALNRRQASCLAEAAQSLSSASSARDCVLLAEDLRAARSAFDRLTGRAGVEDVLDALFGRFCLGK
jgi:tRNA modification GTPase